MNQVLRALDPKRNLRFFFAETTDLIETMRSIHHTSPTATAALGRLLTMAGLMSLDLKGEKDSLTLKIRGDGPAGLLVAEGRPGGALRALMDHPEADCPPKSPVKLDVGRLVGSKGTLAVIRDYGLKEPYAGTSPLVSGEVAEDMAHYFYYSEQNPSVVSLGVLVGEKGVLSAGGLWIQALPEASEVDLRELEEAVASLPPISGLFIEEGSLEQKLKELFPHFELQFLGTQMLRYACPCSRERVEQALISLGNELEDIAAEGKTEELVCHFCHTHYLFSHEELKNLIKKARE